MVRALTVCALLVPLLCVVSAGDFLKHPDATPAPPPPPFSDVKDGRTLHNKIAGFKTQFDAERAKIAHEARKKRFLLKKPVLQAIKDSLAKSFTFLEELKESLQQLNERAIMLKNDIPQKILHPARTKLVQLQSDSHKSFDDLKKLQKEFNCKFMRRCFTDDLAKAKAIFQAKLKKVASVDEECKGKFSKQCTQHYRIIKEDLEDLLKDNVRPLDSLLDDIHKAECYQLERQRLRYRKDVLDITTRVRGWILNVKSKLKMLIANEMHEIKKEFDEHCDVLNKLKIKAKDLEDDPHELKKLKPGMAEVLEWSKVLQKRFLHVYDTLHTLQDCLSYEDYSECYDFGSKLYYKITGFHLQIQDCVAALDKRITVIAFKKDKVAKQKAFLDIFDDFKEKIKELHKIPQFSMCGRIANLKHTFKKVKADLEECQEKIKELLSRLSDELTGCPEFDEFKNDLDALAEDAEHHLEAVTYQLSFFEIYDNFFCHKHQHP